MIATYAAYVWSCYGVTAFVLVLNIWLARRSQTQAKLQARRRLQASAERPA